MTAAWWQSTARLRCGYCHADLPPGSPVRRLRTGAIRCAACAKAMLGEDVPGDLAQTPLPMPSRETATPDARPLQPFVERFKARMREIVDVKRRAGGDR